MLRKGICKCFSFLKCFLKNLSIHSIDDAFSFIFSFFNTFHSVVMLIARTKECEWSLPLTLVVTLNYSKITRQIVCRRSRSLQIQIRVFQFGGDHVIRLVQIHEQRVALVSIKCSVECMSELQNHPLGPHDMSTLQ